MSPSAADTRPAGEPVRPLSLDGVALAVRWPHEEQEGAVELMSTRLAPSAALAEAARLGRVSTWDADVRYRAELEAMVREGELALEVRRVAGSAAAVRCGRLGQWCPGTVLRDLMMALGAQAA